MTTDQTTAPPADIEIWHHPSNTTQEVHVRGEVVASGTFAEHDHHGLHLMGITAERIALALGLTYAHRTFNIAGGPDGRHR